MQQRTPSSPISRTSRRHDRQGGYDIADVFEARLLAQGIRDDDFITRRSIADNRSIPNLTPIRFGRGAEDNPFPPLALADDESVPDPATEELPS